METLANTAKVLMDTIASHIENTENHANEEISNHGKCISCGKEFEWNPEQWRTNCPECGNVILRRVKKMMTKQSVKCWLCMDTGIVTYQAQMDGIVGIYGAACPECDMGKKFPHILKAGEGLLCPSLWLIKLNNKKISKVS